MNRDREFTRIDTTDNGPTLIFQYTSNDGSITEESMDIAGAIARMTDFINEKISFLQEKLHERQLGDSSPEKEIIALSDKINKLDAEKDSIGKMIRKFISSNAGRDFSRSNNLFKQAFNHLLNGRMDKAVILLNEARIFEKQEHNSSELQQMAENCRLMAMVYLIKGDQELAKENFEEAVSLYPCWDHYMAAADFYKGIDKYDNAENYFQLALASPARDQEKIVSLIELGNLAGAMQEKDKAEGFYKQANHIGRNSREPEDYTRDVLSADVNLFSLYVSNDDFGPATLLLQDILKQFQTLDKDRLKEFLPHLIVSYYVLADRMQRTGEYKEAETYCQKSIDLLLNPPNADPDHAIELANSYNLLGIIYEKQADAINGHLSFEKGLAILEALPDQRNTKLLHALARILQNRGGLYLDYLDVPSCRKCYEQSLKIYRQLATINPKVFLQELAVMLSNMAGLYKSEDRKDEEHTAITESLNILRSLTEYNPQPYVIDLVIALNNSGNRFLDDFNIREAARCYGEAMELVRVNSEKHPKRFLPYYASTFINFGTLQLKVGHPDEAIKVFNAALDIRKLLAEENPRSFQGDVAMTFINLGHAYRGTLQNDLAEKAYLSALEIFRQEAEVQPDLYLPEVGMSLLNLVTVKENWREEKDVPITHLRQAIKIFTPYRHLVKVQGYWRSVAAMARELGVEIPE